MKALVCGGRDFYDKSRVFLTLDKCREWWNITTVIHGAARGADTLANSWAKERKLEIIKCPARWSIHGKKAGVIRNREMLNLTPDVVIAFPGGTGTENMIQISREAEIPVFIV